nr:hypothetical protein [Tanacetum cinerariifolium]
MAKQKIVVRVTMNT